MLRRKEDMKDWQAEALPKEEKIVGRKAPNALPIEPPKEVPKEFVEEVKESVPVEKKPVKKATTKKKTTKKVEKMSIDE